MAEEIAAADVPELIAALVKRGGRIQAVIPTRQSLEDRFISLLGGAGGEGGAEDEAK